MESVCFVHQRTQDDVVMLVMRADRYIPAWNRDLRERLGEDSVVQLRVAGGKTAWGVPWDYRDGAYDVSAGYFEQFVTERESVLGYPPISEDDESYAWFEEITKTDDEESDYLIDETVTVDRIARDPGARVSSIYMSNSNLEIKYSATDEEAREFGALLYSDVRVMVEVEE